MTIALKISAVLALFFLTACAQPPVVYLPAEKQRVAQDVELNVPAAQKAAIEFSIDTYENATFAKVTDGKLCQGATERKPVVVTRARDMPQSEDNVRKVAAVLSLGLTNLWDPRNGSTPHVMVREFEAGQELIWNASSYLLKPDNTSVSCGPLYLKFTPQGGRRYRMNFVRGGGAACHVELLDITEPAVSQGVDHARWGCSPSFLGVGGGAVSGYRETGAAK